MFCSVERCWAFFAPASESARKSARIAMITATFLSSDSTASSSGSAMFPPVFSIKGARADNSRAQLRFPCHKRERRGKLAR